MGGCIRSEEEEEEEEKEPILWEPKRERSVLLYVCLPNHVFSSSVFLASRPYPWTERKVLEEREREERGWLVPSPPV